jgi:hypothetical protein
MAKAAVTFSTLPEQTHNNSVERNCRKCNAKQSLYIIINNNKFAEHKMLSTLPIKIIPLPFARLEDVPRSVPRPALLPLPLADHRKLTGTSQPNARGTLLPP